MQITSDAEHDAALHRVQELTGCIEDSPEDSELAEIAEAIHEREALHAPPSEAELQARAAEVRAKAADAVDYLLKEVAVSSQDKAERRAALTDEPAMIEAVRSKGGGR